LLVNEPEHKLRSMTLVQAGEVPGHRLIGTVQGEPAPQNSTPNILVLFVDDLAH
jgi:hypothetical protein